MINRRAPKLSKANLGYMESDINLNTDLEIPIFFVLIVGKEAAYT